MPSYKEMLANRRKMIDDASGYGSNNVNNDPILRQNEDFKKTKAVKTSNELDKVTRQAERERKAAKAAARRALGMPE